LFTIKDSSRIVVVGGVIKILGLISLNKYGLKNNYQLLYHCPHQEALLEKKAV